jgi:predicted ATPase
MILDDLQWADPGSLTLLQQIWSTPQEGLPLLILCSARPEFLEESGGVFTSENIIHIKPLAVDPVLVRQAYPVLKNVDDELLRILAEKAQGNPYYLEEMVKTVVVNGMVDEKKVFTLPETLEGLLQSRLDSLTLEGRASAYFASVAGRAFWKGSVLAAFRGAPGVTQVLDVSSHNLVGKVQRALDELMEKELAFLRVGSAFAGDREYIFKHSLLHQVAYHRLPEDLRAACHHAVALWLVERAGPERSISVAHHFEKAGANDRAQEYYTLAAEHARSLGRDEEADDIQYYARTLPGDDFG